MACGDKIYIDGEFLVLVDSTGYKNHYLISRIKKIIGVDKNV